ncbi:hypothetical protein HBI25_172000 [Parastagonospora nodorum]|nr:hypothetical protein HBH51_190140 [Parastagonospora nodorum]KAH4022457.1 hypothetical protein HBI09_169630 [Parastagonospora nodorum]KAH4052221.1 hypothetical protein HBH49_098130 [Parastagonospora nodorum]KAH4070945.1 hypothetical protein HBH50_091250 [Parastagonospora nodorum]KAH4081352.1 hypothetical protein HBH46_226350 [Parastagonospora nodorum]
MAKVVPATKTTRKHQSTAEGTGPIARTKNAKVTKPTVSAPKAPKAKGIPTDNIFGHHLPSARLRLPSAGNISALEQVVFLTETIRSRDPLNRLVQNGFDTKTLQFIINQHRTFPKYPLKGNSLGAILRNTMREWQVDWTFRNQKSGTYQDKKPAPDNLTLANMQLNCQDLSEKNGNGEGVIENVPFEALAVDVTRLPDGDDALDLTRCIIWSLHNPGSGLLYPRDFVWLTHQLGGPKPVQQANHDEEVFRRWHEADSANKTLIIQTEDEVNKSEAAMNEAQTPAAHFFAKATHTTATAALAASITAQSALVTLEDGHHVIHQHLVPHVPHASPDMGAVAHYLAQLNHQPSVHLPFGTQLSFSHSREDGSGVVRDLSTLGYIATLPSVRPPASAIDAVSYSHNVADFTFQHPEDLLKSGKLYQEVQPSNIGSMGNYTTFDDFSFSDFPLEDSDYAMAAEFLRLSGW